MSGMSALDRLLAWSDGAPTPLGTTLPWPRSDGENQLILAFVRMGGESSPWGVAIGHPETGPSFYSCPEPRNVDGHAAFVHKLHEPLLSHLRHPIHFSAKERGAFLEKPAELAPLTKGRQVWVPGSTHLDMLHFLDFRYTLAATGDEARLAELRALGRTCGFLFRESTRPGQVRVHDATMRLRQVFAFPAELPRQAHLGFLLAWLKAEGSSEELLAAARRAEADSVGATLDPDYEEEHLVELVEQYNRAKGDAAETERLARAIHEALVPELERRWRLTLEAVRLLAADPRPDNPQLKLVVELGDEEFFYQYWSPEAKGLDPSLSPEERRFLVKHPETDFRPAQAARRYYAHLHAFELAAAELVHGDPALVEQALDGGEALRGIVRQVRKGGKGEGGPFWTIECRADDSLRLREESKVALAGVRKRTATIRSIENQGDLRTIVVEITGIKTKRGLPDQPNADDVAALVGTTVTFIDDAGAGLSKIKAIRVGSADGPGAWLTHSAPPPEPAPATTIRPDLLDFVRSLEGAPAGSGGSSRGPRPGTA